MAFSKSPSPASRLLQIEGMFGIADSHKTCRSRLAGDSVFTDAIAGKPAPTDYAEVRNCGSRKSASIRTLDDLRRLTKGANKRPAHPLAITKTGLCRHHIDGVPAGFHHQSRGLHPQVFNGLGG